MDSRNMNRNRYLMLTFITMAMVLALGGLTTVSQAKDSAILGRFNTIAMVASTVPAKSLPMILYLGLTRPTTSRKGNGVPRSRCQSPAFADAA